MRRFKDRFNLVKLFAMDLAWVGMSQGYLQRIAENKLYTLLKILRA